MAGPFDPIQQQDIATPRLQQTVSAHGADAAQALAGAAVTAVAGVQNYRKETKKDALEGQIDAVVEGIRVFREGDQSSIKELEDAAKAGNATARAKLEEFRGIQRAVAQGRLPSDAAAVRLRAITKAAINDAPEFEEEFRATARQALGFSPEAEVARRALREPTHTGGKTKAQIEQEEFEALAQRIQRISGASPEEAQRIAIGRLRTELEANNARDLMTLGDQSDRVISQHANAAGSAIMQDTLAFVADQMQANGGIFDINAAQLMLKSQVAAQRSKALAGVTDARVAGQINQNFDNAHQSMRQLLELASKQEQADQFMKTMASLQAANMALTHPELQAWMALPNSETLFKVLEVSSKLNNNPALQKALGYTGQAEGLSQGARVFEGLPVEFRSAMLSMFQGKPPATEEERRIRAYGARELLKDTTVDEKQSQSLLSDLVDTSGEYTAITALDDAKILAKVGNSPALKAQVQNLLGSKLEGMTARIQMLKDSVVGMEVIVVGDKLETRGLPPQVTVMPNFQNPAGHPLRRDVELRDAVVQYNRVLAVNNKYAKIGAATEATASSALVEPTADTPEVVAKDEGQPTVTRRLRYNTETGALEEVK